MFFLHNAYLEHAQHHDGDGHKNGMRGFHLKIFPESGAPDFEVVLAEVGRKLHASRSQNLILIMFLLGLERWR
jgi:hypothetical protein